MNHRPNRPFSTSPSPLARIAGFVLSLVFLVIAFMFSLLAVAVVAIAGVVLAGWFWWKTRALRQQMAAAGVPPSAHRARDDTDRGQVIEGEWIRQPSADGGDSERLLR